MALLLNRGGDYLLEAGRFGKRECCNWRGGNDGVFARRSHKMGQPCADIKLLPVFHRHFKLSGVTQVHQRV